MDNNPPEINRKRRIDGHESSIPRKLPHHPTDHLHEENDNGGFLTLSLSSFFPAHHNRYPLPPPPPPLPISPLQAAFPPLPPIGIAPPSAELGGVPRRRGRRRNPSKSPSEGKSETVSQPFPWATNRRATVHQMSYLVSKQITTITGDVQCKRCERQYTMEYDLEEKFLEIGTFIAENKSSMHHRAPKELLNPTLPGCRFCEQENSVRPLISEKKRSINWLFLLLGKMLGCCTLDQLKYFCKHTKNHRTGAKDRVLFLTYLDLCKQLSPNGPFTI